MVFRICAGQNHGASIAPVIDNIFHAGDSRQMADPNRYLYMVSVQIVDKDDRKLKKSGSYHALHGVMYQAVHDMAAKFDKGEYRSMEISIDATSDPWFSAQRGAILNI